MIQTLQYRLPLASFTINRNNHPLMKEGCQESAVRQLYRRIDVRSLTQRAILNLAMICPFIYHPLLTRRR